MNKSVFLNLVLQQQPITEPETEALEALAKNFPYCQTAHLLLAKAAYDRGSMLSNQKLRMAAVYATNRQLLKKLIYTTTATVTLHPVLAGVTAPETTAQATEEQPNTSTSSVTQLPETAIKEALEESNNEPELTEAAIALQTLETEDKKTETVSGEIPQNATQAPAPAVTVAGADEAAIENTEEPEDLPAEMPLTGAEASAVAGTIYHEESPGAIEETPTAALANAPESVDEELARLLVIDHILNDPHLFTTGKPENKAEELPEEPSATAADEEAEEETNPETLSDFDQYLFKPEREKLTTDKEENLQVSYPDDEAEKIFREDPLGYWMNSSRLGECLQLKEVWTTHQLPYDFHPELLLEYNKENQVTKTIEPSDSILSQQLDIIDQFLKQNPRLKAMAHTKNIRTEPLEDLSVKSTKIKKDMASENLAHIFMQQGKIKKAIKIYEHLMLKIPEKKAYFVAQIEKLKNTL